MQGARAAEGQEREVARIVTTLDRDEADRADHVIVDDRKDAARGRIDAHPERLGDTGSHRAASLLLVEREAAAEQERRKVPENEMGVGDGRLVAAAPIAGGPGRRPGALRADREHAACRDARDRAAAGPDGDEIDHGQPHRPAGDLSVHGQPRPAVVDESDVGRGAADVDADKVPEPGARAREACPDRSRRGSGEGRLDRRPAYRARARHPAARLHQEERRPRCRFSSMRWSSRST